MAQQGNSTWTILFVVLFGGVGFLLGRVTAPHWGGFGHGCKKHSEACSHHEGHGSHEDIAIWCEEGGEKFHVKCISSDGGSEVVEALVLAGFEGDTTIHSDGETIMVTVDVEASPDEGLTEVVKKIRVVTEEVEEK